jgi:hypothetical protein
MLHETRYQITEKNTGPKIYGPLLSEGATPKSHNVKKKKGLGNKKGTQQPENGTQKSAHGGGRKNAAKWWDCHTLALNMEDQRLLCVFKE